MLDINAVPALPPVVTQVVAFTTATKSAQLSRQTQAVTVTCSVAAYVACGDTGIVATATNGAYCPANVPMNFLVPPLCFISVLQVGAGGNAFITEWNR